MKLFQLVIITCCLELLGCAQTKLPPKPSNYDTPDLAPQFTDDFILMEKRIFEHPALGTMLRYLDQSNPNDNITVYIYPTDTLAWDDPLPLINAELQRSLVEIDHAVAKGHYKSRAQATISEFTVNGEHQTYVGKKAQLNIVNRRNETYYSDIFIFLQQDKFIKFRTSFNGEHSHFWTGDDIVNSILPELNVPPESPFMKQVRRAYKNKLQRQGAELKR